MFPALMRTIDLKNLPDITSLAASSRVQNLIEYYTNVPKNRSSRHRVEYFGHCFTQYLHMHRLNSLLVRISPGSSPSGGLLLEIFNCIPKVFAHPSTQHTMTITAVKVVNSLISKNGKPKSQWETAEVSKLNRQCA